MIQFESSASCEEESDLIYWETLRSTFNLWTGRTGCIQTLNSWKFQKSSHKILLLPVHQFSAERKYIYKKIKIEKLTFRAHTQNNIHLPPQCHHQIATRSHDFLQLQCSVPDSDHCKDREKHLPLYMKLQHLLAPVCQQSKDISNNTLYFYLFMCLCNLSYLIQRLHFCFGKILIQIRRKYPELV